VVIASYTVSYLTYNKTFYVFLKYLKRRFFFTYQNSNNTGHRTRLGLKTNLPEYFKMICMFTVCIAGQWVNRRDCMTRKNGIQNLHALKTHLEVCT